MAFSAFGIGSPVSSWSPVPYGQQGAFSPTLGHLPQVLQQLQQLQIVQLQQQHQIQHVLQTLPPQLQYLQQAIQYLPQQIAQMVQQVLGSSPFIAGQPAFGAGPQIGAGFGPLTPSPLGQTPFQINPGGFTASQPGQVM